MAKVLIRAFFQDREVVELKKTAKLLNVKVSEIVRQRSTTTHEPVPNRKRYAYCVEQAALAAPNLPLDQIEQIVGTTIVALHHK